MCYALSITLYPFFDEDDDREYEDDSWWFV